MGGRRATGMGNSVLMSNCCDGVKFGEFVVLSRAGSGFNFGRARWCGARFVSFAMRAPSQGCWRWWQGCRRCWWHAARAVRAVGAPGVRRWCVRRAVRAVACRWCAAGVRCC
jgi:hypothetical protein